MFIKKSSVNFDSAKFSLNMVETKAWAVAAKYQIQAEPAGIYLLNVNNRNARIRCGVVPVSLLLTLNKFHTLS